LRYPSSRLTGPFCGVYFGGVGTGGGLKSKPLSLSVRLIGPFCQTYGFLDILSRRTKVAQSRINDQEARRGKRKKSGRSDDENENTNALNRAPMMLLKAYNSCNRLRQTPTNHNRGSSRLLHTIGIPFILMSKAPGLPLRNFAWDPYPDGMISSRKPLPCLKRMKEKIMAPAGAGTELRTPL
jgi:hypothetical protein